MKNSPEDFGPGLNARAGIRYLYSKFSFGGDESDEYKDHFVRVFGEKPSKFCDKCERLKSWCECEQGSQP